MKRLIAVLCAALMLLTAGAAAARVPVYRVGYTPTPGFFTRAQDGSYHGSGYAYLEELSLYAGCRFDYVELPLGQEYERLRAGDVDIFVGGSGTPFPDLLYSRHDIARPALELSLARNTAQELPAAPRIAYFSAIHTSSALRTALTRFFPKGDFTLVPYDDLASMDRAVAGGDVDALTNDSFHAHPGTHPIGNLRRLSSYLVLAHGSAALCAQLDQAADEMLTVTPNLRATLEQQTGRGRAPLFLTPEEKAYLAEHNHFTAFASPKQEPYSYFEDGAHRGIVHDIIARMESDLGITFEVRETPTEEALFEQLDNGGADVILDVYFDFSWARQHGIHITNPYISPNYVPIRRRGQALPAAPRVAATRGRNFTRQYIEQTYPAEQIIYFDTDDQCLAAVNDGRADLAFVKSVSVHALLYRGLFYRLTSENYVIFSHGTSIGVSEHIDPILVRILNKEIAHLAPEFIQGCIDEETAAVNNNSPISSLLYRYPKESVLLLSLVFVALLAGGLFFLYVRRSHLAAITRLAYHEPVTGLCNERWLEQALPGAIRAEREARESGRLYLAGICVHQLDYLRATFALNLLAKSFADISRRAHETFPWFKKYAISTDRTRLIVLCALPEHMTPEAAADAITEHFSSVPLGGVVTRVRYHMSFLPIHWTNAANPSQLLGECLASLNYAREHNLPFVLFDQDMHDRFLWNKHLEELAPKAFARQEFAVWYQPKYDLATKKLVGAEALVRWQSPELGLLTPGRFIDYFERIGLAIRLDYYMLGHVAR
ncbi:EAL domain-containing protein, partial [uncultured Selenomonas sp.]|uniref:EAL domain-containing protein n=1 Tax=uncultured Selenomonas sp. TaxID=159275 RepID=UPI00258BB1A6